MESLIDNQQVDLQIGFRPGTQPSNNEQMKVERDNRLRSRVLKDEEANNDDDEERYCFCNQLSILLSVNQSKLKFNFIRISFGEMVGCDNGNYSKILHIKIITQNDFRTMSL